VIVIQHPTLEVSKGPVLLTALLYAVEDLINPSHHMGIVDIHPIFEALGESGIKFAAFLNSRDSICEAIVYKDCELSFAYLFTIGGDNLMRICMTIILHSMAFSGFSYISSIVPINLSLGSVPFL
jgi:hypothetical protein